MLSCTLVLWGGEKFELPLPSYAHSGEQVTITLDMLEGFVEINGMSNTPPPLLVFLTS